MREKINRLSRGIIDRDENGPSVDPSSLEAPVTSGGHTSGEITVSNPDGRYIKGLVYSSDTRVKVKNDSFGGLRNRIAFDVDSTHLTLGDTVEGTLDVITDRGESSVPYSFPVVINQSGMALAGLDTAKDFAGLCRNDPELGLRLFGYEDFISAPFMQDSYTRVLYDGLKKRPDRRNSLEEFLVALKLKQPVELVMSGTPRRYRADAKVLGDVINVKKSTWGYVRFDVSTDGDFLKLSQTSFGPDDFDENGECVVPYEIDRSKLHAGHNLGAIHIDTVRDSRVIQIEVRGKEHKSPDKKEPAATDFGRYLSLRLQYEMKDDKDMLLLGELHKQLDTLYDKYEDTLTVTILDAELCMATGDPGRARSLLEAKRGEMAERRQEKPLEYCYYTYMQIELNGRGEQKDALIHLVRRYIKEANYGSLFYLWLKLEPGMYDRPDELLGEMRDSFRKGCHSPFLYDPAVRLFERHPEIITRAGDFEMQVLLFAVRKERIDPETAWKAVQIIVEKRHFDKLGINLLTKMYECYRDPRFLSAVCAMLIKGDCRGPQYFRWYEAALNAGISLTGLYEYYLYTLPKEYPYLLPREVLLYFSYGKSLDDDNRALLYMNILRFMKQDTPLYQQYEKEIREFTMDQLLRGKVNRRTLVLYEHILYPEMIDRKVARVLPTVLNSYRIRVKNPNMKYVIVCYEELNDEDAYPIQDGIAYVPLFLEHNLILFQDRFGNRFYNIPFRKSPALEKMDVETMEKRCYEIFPDHPMLRLRECQKIMSEGVNSRKDLDTLRKTMADLPLHPLFARRVSETILDCRLRQFETSKPPDNSDTMFLLSLDPETLSRAERVRIIEAFTDQKYYKEAWDLLMRCGKEGVSDEKLMELCSFRILHQTSPGFDELLSWTCELFTKGVYDDVMLDFLCEQFDGSTDKMYRILEEAEKRHIEVYDLPERLLAQMLFCGYDDRMDQVFEWYMATKQSTDSLVRAYLTRKCANYFLKGMPTDESFFEWLEAYLAKAEELKKMPLLYLVATGMHYSELDGLTEEQKKLCGEVLETLLDDGRVFAWFQKLGKMVPLPESIMDQTILEYRCRYEEQPDEKPSMMIRILPGEEDFHPEELSRVYPGIYVMQETLFSGESLEYRISEMNDGQDEVTEEGVIAPDPDRVGIEGSRYAELDDICRTFAEGEDGLQEKMTKYLADHLIMEDLFPFM